MAAVLRVLLLVLRLLNSKKKTSQIKKLGNVSLFKKESSDRKCGFSRLICIFLYIRALVITRANAGTVSPPSNQRLPSVRVSLGDEHHYRHQQKLVEVEGGLLEN